MDISKTKLTESKLVELDFAETTCKGCRFNESDFMGSVFRNTELSEADFRDAKNYSINVRDNRVSGAKFSYPEVMTLLYEVGVEVE